LRNETEINEAESENFRLIKEFVPQDLGFWYIDANISEQPAICIFGVKEVNLFYPEMEVATELPKYPRRPYSKCTQL
jgi:hypothetical protein